MNDDNRTHYPLPPGTGLHVQANHRQSFQLPTGRSTTDFIISTPAGSFPLHGRLTSTALADAVQPLQRPARHPDRSTPVHHPDRDIVAAGNELVNWHGPLSKGKYITIPACDQQFTCQDKIFGLAETNAMSADFEGFAGTSDFDIINRTSRPDKTRLDCADFHLAYPEKFKVDWRDNYKDNSFVTPEGEKHVQTAALQMISTDTGSICMLDFWEQGYVQRRFYDRVTSPDNLLLVWDVNSEKKFHKNSPLVVRNGIPVPTNYVDLFDPTANRPPAGLNRLQEVVLKKPQLGPHEPGYWKMPKNGSAPLFTYLRDYGQFRQMVYYAQFDVQFFALKLGITLQNCERPPLPGDKYGYYKMLQQDKDMQRLTFKLKDAGDLFDDYRAEQQHVLDLRNADPKLDTFTGGRYPNRDCVFFISSNTHDVIPFNLLYPDNVEADQIKLYPALRGPGLTIRPEDMDRNRMAFDKVIRMDPLKFDLLLMDQMPDVCISRLKNDHYPGIHNSIIPSPDVEVKLGQGQFQGSLERINKFMSASRTHFYRKKDKEEEALPPVPVRDAAGIKLALDRRDRTILKRQMKEAQANSAGPQEEEEFQANMEDEQQQTAKRQLQFPPPAHMQLTVQTAAVDPPSAPVSGDPSMPSCSNSGPPLSTTPPVQSSTPSALTAPGHVTPQPPVVPIASSDETDDNQSRKRKHAPKRSVQLPPPSTESSGAGPSALP